MIQAGVYRARAVDAEIGMTSTGKEQIAVRFRLGEGTQEGSTIVWFSFFNTSENAKRTLESLRHCGWSGNDLSDLRGIEANDVEIVVEIDTYGGVERSKVRWVNPVGGGGPILAKRLNEAEKKAFAARMKGLAVSTTASQGAGLAPKGAVSVKESTYPSNWDE